MSKKPNNGQNALRVKLKTIGSCLYVVWGISISLQYSCYSQAGGGGGGGLLEVTHDNIK